MFEDAQGCERRDGRKKTQSLEYAYTDVIDDGHSGSSADAE
jgi:hypothetical protein